MTAVAFLIPALLILLIWEFLRKRPVRWSFQVPEMAYGEKQPHMAKLFAHIDAVGARHAPAFVEQNGKLHLVWFEGSREAAPDVKIRGVDLESGQISDWFGVEDLSRQMRPREFLRVIGNTIGLSQDRFLTTFVSIGGWAGSSLALCSFGPTGALQAKRMVTNPYANRSHLVRAPAVSYGDGDQLVPAYFEARHGFAAFLRITPAGDLIARSRTGHGRQLVQPTIQVMDATSAFALSRSFDGSAQLYRSETADGGRSWTRAVKTDVPCSGSPVGLVALTDGRILMAHIPDVGTRKILRLCLSADAGHTWTTVHEFDEGADPDLRAPLRYPALHARKDGQIFLTASVGSKKGVVVFQFNQAWVDTQEASHVS